MGEVYLAEDTRLGRQVALKLLRPDFTKNEGRVGRFQQEARAASALNHPNILTIFEIGQADDVHFIATEFIEGETVRQHMASTRMELRDVLDVAIQVASALAAAHQAGIVHRDIKPENIMLRRDGYVKVLDFGLAKLAERPVPVADADALTIAKVNTDPGTVLGTANYMSPEQARGLAVDARTDIFSLGVVLYEVIAGRVPFAGATTTDVIIAIVEKEPGPLIRYAPDVPAELERIVTKALAKDREERFQTAKDLLIDLRRLKQRLEFEAELERSIHPEVSGATTVTRTDAQAILETAKGPVTRTGEIGAARPTSSAEYLINEIRRHKGGVVLALATLIMAVAGIVYFGGRDTAINSVAVLPFVNVGADPNTEYLSDGITESLINSLSQLPNLAVMSSTSVFHYKGREIDPLAVGRELKVKAVLTGRVVQRGDNLWISAELVDVNTNHHIWGGQFNRKLADIIVVQEEIAKQISEKLRLRLTGEETARLTKRHTENTEAYQLYLKGRYWWNKRTEESLKKGIEYFNQAIAQDPSYALAYAGLADSYNLLPRYGSLPPGEAFPKAKAAATRALELDDALAEAHTSLAYASVFYDWDWSGAEREFKRAIELNPTYATAHHWYALYLAAKGRLDEAITEMKRAQELDPLSLIINSNFGRILYYARQYDQAIEQYRKTLDLDQNFVEAHLRMAQAYQQQGMYADAISELQKVITLSQGSTGKGMVGYVYAASGKKAQAQQVLDELKGQAKQGYVSAYDLALIYLGLGDKDQAFKWLQQAYEERNVLLVYLKVDPMFDSLRSDRRFQNLLQRIGLH